MSSWPGLLRLLVLAVLCEAAVGIVWMLVAALVLFLRLRRSKRDSGLS